MLVNLVEFEILGYYSLMMLTLWRLYNWDIDLLKMGYLGYCNSHRHAHRNTHRHRTPSGPEWIFFIGGKQCFGERQSRHGTETLMLS